MRRRPPLDARPESNRLGVLGRTFPHGRIFLPPPPTRALDARTDARDLTTIFIVFDRVDRSLHGLSFWSSFGYLFAMMMVARRARVVYPGVFGRGARSAETAVVCARVVSLHERAVSTDARRAR